MKLSTLVHEENNTSELENEMSDDRGPRDETPEEWLADLFEFEYCPECGGDAEDHEVCLVPGIGNFFARCLGPGLAEGGDEPSQTGGRSSAAGLRSTAPSRSG